MTGIVVLPILFALLAAYAVVCVGLALISLTFAPLRLWLLLRR